MRHLPLLVLLAACSSGTGSSAGGGAEQTLDACRDGVDNDGDGLIDCADPDCVIFSICAGDGGPLLDAQHDGRGADGPAVPDAAQPDAAGPVDAATRADAAARTDAAVRDAATRADAATRVDAAAREDAATRADAAARADAAVRADASAPDASTRADAGTTTGCTGAGCDVLVSTPAGTVDRVNPECAFGGNGHAFVDWGESPDRLMIATSNDGVAFDAPVHANAGFPAAYFYGSHPVVSDAAGYVYIVYDAVSPATTAYFLDSFDAVTFSGGLDVRSTSENALYASLGVHGSSVRVAWSGYTGAEYDPFVSGADRVFSGPSFSTAVPVVSDAEQDDATAIAILSDGTIVVAWNSFDGDVFISRAGTSGFSTPARANAAPGHAHVGLGTFMVADEGDVVYVAWSDTRSDSEGDLCINVSSDGGTSFGGERPLASSTTRYQEDPSLAALPGGGVVATWQDYRDGTYDIRWIQADRSGAAIGSDAVANAVTGGDQENPCVAVGPTGRMLFAWRDYRGGPLGTPDVYARFVGP